jgi:hypothetical protein
MNLDLFTYQANLDSDSLRLKYERFHQANPWVFNELARLALDLRARGVNQYGIAALFEVLRYQHTLRTNDGSSPFKLSNSYRAFYARDLMAAYPDRLAGFFVTRPSVADGDL